MTATRSSPPSHTAPDGGRVLFVGVSTGGSAATAAFPEWGPALGLHPALEGIDLPPDSPPASYRKLIERIRADTSVAGAVVTVHKTALFAHAAGLLDELGPAAQLAGEISVVYRHGRQLAGGLIEPASVRSALRGMLPAGHWDHASDLVIFGAGGTARAILLALFHPVPGQDGPPGRPRQVTVFDTGEQKLTAIRALHAALATPARLDARLNSPGTAPGPLAGIRPGALIVNATGLGKDRPGSPLPLPACWPAGSVVWEINYRGERPFWRDALRQASHRHLRVHDGWTLFVQGWAESLARITGRELTAAEVTRLDETAQRLRR